MAQLSSNIYEILLIIGFNLWTSAHGFHHFSLSDSGCWVLTWGLILLLCVAGLILCVIYYFVFVFSTAVFSKIIVESPPTRSWPVTIICERQPFQLNKIEQVPNLTIEAASTLTWTLSGSLARPIVWDTFEGFDVVVSNLSTILSRPSFNDSYDALLEALTPNCTEFILECNVAEKPMGSAECCQSLFNPQPFFNEYGVCFTTRNLSELNVARPGRGFGVRVVTLHEDAIALNKDLAAQSFMGGAGVAFAVTNEFESIESTLRTRGHSVSMGQSADIGISRLIIDDTILRDSVIAKLDCATSGSRAGIDTDLLIGIPQNYGYTKDNCLTAKNELLARESELNCSFHPDESYRRCTYTQSASYYRSFLDTSNIPLAAVPTVNYTDALRKRYEKNCPKECKQDIYSISVSYSELSATQKEKYASEIGNNDQNNQVTVLNFYLEEMDYQKIVNFPQHGMQFLAEVGGLMAFFLGISIVSVFECICYVGFLTKRSLCNCSCCGEDPDEDEDLPPPKWHRHGHSGGGGRDVILGQTYTKTTTVPKRAASLRKIITQNIKAEKSMSIIKV